MLMNPIESFLNTYGEKTAGKPIFNLGWREMANHAGNALATGVAVGIGSAALAGGATAVKQIYNAATAKRDFRGMMAFNQDLHHEDQSLVNQSFKTLRRFAPNMSRDPLVAGAMIRQMVQSPQGAAGVIQQALSAQKNIDTPVLKAAITEGGKGVSGAMKDFEPFGTRPGQMRRDEHERLLNEQAQKHTFNELRSKQIPFAPVGAPFDYGNGPVNLNYFGMPDIRKK